MFGSIMAISNDDLVLSIICSVIVIVMFVLFYNKIFAVTFDENFSKATGVKSGVYNTIIAVSYTHLDVYKRQVQRIPRAVTRTKAAKTAPNRPSHTNM